MFMEPLLDSPASNRRRWTTLLSFAVQGAAVGLLVLTPLFYTQALPNLVRSVLALPAPPAAEVPRAARPRSRGPSQSEVVGETVRQPARIPLHAAIIHDGRPLEAPPEPAIVTVPFGTGDPRAWRDSPLSEIVGRGAPPPLPAPPARLRVSDLSKGYLLYQVKPVYPPLARSAHVQGEVVLNAVISRAGAIEGLRVLSGHPLLIPAAMDAVRHWRYRPYLLNGSPVEVETRITVNFTLAAGS